MPIQSVNNSNLTQLLPTPTASKVESEQTRVMGSPQSEGAVAFPQEERLAASNSTANGVSSTSPDAEAINKAVQKMNDFLSGAKSNVEFSVDKETGIQVIKVVERGTNDVIRQIPSKEALQIAKALDTLQGMLVREKA